MNLTTVLTENAPAVHFHGEPQEIFYPETDGKPMAETDIHRKTATRLTETLEAFLIEQKEVYVSGNLLVYYEEDNPRKCLAPDVFIVKNVPKHARRIFKIWEEKTVPTVIFGILSKQTVVEDLQTKFVLCQKLGVKEFFIFDPEYDYLKKKSLLAYRLRDGEYEQLKVVKGRVMSEELNLGLIDTRKTLRLFDPATNEFLLTPEEERKRREESEIRLQAIEAENERLKAELARLKNE